jgi:hypothetical protein
MPLDTHALPPPLQPTPTRSVIDQHGYVALLEIAGGDGRWIGPETSHAELERLARDLLAATGPGGYLPPIVHKLALGYLAARRLERVA